MNRSRLSDTEIAAMWIVGALAFIGWCAYVGWAWVTFYEYSGAMRGFLVGVGVVIGLLLALWIAICAIATDEWAEV